MTFRFELDTYLSDPPWKTISSLNYELIDDWIEIRNKVKPHFRNSRMEQRIGSEQLKYHIASNKQILHFVNKVCRDTITSMYKSVVFIFTSVEGIVLSLIGPEETENQLNHIHNVGAGSLFTISNAGMNAISMAIELQSWVFLSGAEHDLELFKGWNCFCCPVLQDEKVIGYIDMSFSVDDDHLIMASLFSSVLKGIEYELSQDNQQESICERFRKWRLSPREREIGLMWLNNYSALRIASELGITEGTVRNVIKKIYRKTEVCDKGQFMRKFLQTQIAEIS